MNIEHTLHNPAAFPSFDSPQWPRSDVDSHLTAKWDDEMRKVRNNYECKPNNTRTFCIPSVVRGGEEKRT